MTLNTKPKINKDQNLISAQLTYKYIYQKTMMPALIIIIAIAFISVALFYGVQKGAEVFDDKSFELISQDLSESNKANANLLKDKTAIRDGLQSEYDNYYINNPIDVQVDDSILTILQNDIVRLEQSLRDLENSGKEEVVVDVLKKYHVEELLLYLDEIRNDDIILVSIEDARTESSTGNSHLTYEDDIGGVSFSLHGISTSSDKLSTFLIDISNYELVKDAKIVAVETQTMSDGSRLYVFEIVITPETEA